MKTTALFLNILCVFVLSVLIVRDSYSQTWQQAATPEGGGVTDLIVRGSNQNIFVTTGSFNWPSGENGGIRRSTDDGATWENLVDVYNARTIIDGADGNLYASIWPYPSMEGLYRSTDNGDSWGSPLMTVATGNNIFSIALNPATTPFTIFAGTRNGPLRSTDYGTTWLPAIDGIPANSWVRDIEVDSSGIVAAATTNGLFISTNNGDNWEQATGIAAGDTVVKLIFDYFTPGKLGGSARLIAGSEEGSLYESFENSHYLTIALIAIFPSEISGMAVGALEQLNEKLLGVAVFPAGSFGQGFYTSTDNGTTWVPNNSGLPANPKASALAVKYDEHRSAPGDVTFYIGLYDNSSGGAGIFKSTYTLTGTKEEASGIPAEFKLEQNYPNPFNPATKISYALPTAGYVSLKVYDVLGNESAVLVNEDKPAGTYEAEFDASVLASGVYVYRMQAGAYTGARKMVVVK